MKNLNDVHGRIDVRGNEFRLVMRNMENGEVIASKWCLRNSIAAVRMKDRIYAVVGEKCYVNNFQGSLTIPDNEIYQLEIIPQSLSSSLKVS